MKKHLRVLPTRSTQELPALPRLPRLHGGIGRCNECRSPACGKNWTQDDIDAVLYSLTRLA